jgi:hypothetical protein
MSTARQARVRAIASASLVGVAALGLVGLSLRGSSAVGTSPATTAPPPAPATETAPPTTEVAFADGSAASLAAESLIVPYIEAEYGVSVTDVACSEPGTGAEGERFVCYALAPAEEVVALRATIGAELVISLAEITGLTPPTTEAPPATSVEVPTSSIP